jgi:hypothetical protein
MTGQHKAAPGDPRPALAAREPGSASHRRERRRARPEPAVTAVAGEQLLAEPAGSDMTIAELRHFIAASELAAIRAGVDPGPLRPRVAVRHTGAIKGIWIRVGS